jgi:hypothetical protein
MRLKVFPALKAATAVYAAALFAAFLSFSCTTTDYYAPVEAVVATEDYAKSAETLEANSKKIYREKDKVLYYLDKGMLTHYAEDWSGSSALLQDGERAIEENYAVSISQEIGTYLLNDKSREYDGEDYEDVYLNVFNALNYYHRNMNDDAMVEIRRINNKLKNLSVKYGALSTNLQKLALENGVDVPPNPEAPKEFSNSALACYLGMLFYRGEGAADDARIDRDQLKLAFADYPDVYSNKIPSSIDEELAVPAGMARLNVMAFTGRTPVKTEEVQRIPIGYNWIKIALPTLSHKYSSISQAAVVFDTGEKFELELLESLESVAQATFTRKRDIIYLKTVVRATVKGVTAAVFDIMSDVERAGQDKKKRKGEESGGDNSGLFSLLSIGAQLFTEATEQADLRSTRFFPGKAWVGGINLLPGTYSFTVQYYGNGGTIVAERRFEDVPVRAGVLNLTEAVCLK